MCRSVGDLKVSCRTPGVLYKIFCTLCEEEGKESVYVGESGKNSYSRGKNIWRILLPRIAHIVWLFIAESITQMNKYWPPISGWCLYGPIIHHLRDRLVKVCAFTIVM